MISWPGEVNQIIRSDTTINYGVGIIQDTMDSGKKKTRLKSTSVPDTFPVVMQMKKTEFDIFIAWYKVPLHRGAVTFSFPTIAGTGTSEYRILSVSAAGAGGSNVKVLMTWETA
jgi:hypothetical protein